MYEIITFTIKHRVIKMVKSVTQYFTEDGTAFDTYEEANTYEKNALGLVAHNVQEWCKGYSGRKLLEDYALDALGVWQIYGEDPNCSFGGYHHEPLLETVNGTLEQALRYAVQLPKFYSWGSGGCIKPVKVIELGE